MIVDSVLVNAKAYVDGAILECCIAIDDGRIFKIGKETNMPRADKKSDLKNLLVLPGLIDAHVHLRDEAKAYKEDFYSGTAAAAAGGITAVLDMPNNNPVTMSVETLQKRMKIAESRVIVRVGFYSAFPKNIDDIEEIVKKGAVGFKLYMAEQIGGLDIHADQAILEAFRELDKQKVLTAVHAEDEETLKENEDELKRANRNDIKAFLNAHSEQVETKAVNRLLNLERQTRMHLHFCHISTAKGLKAITDAKQSGRPITCETTPHHLFLSDEELEETGASAITVPPVRGKADVEALWQGVSNGAIDILGSDHAPHTLNEKEADTIWNVKVGVPGLETMLPLLLSEVHHGRLSIGDIVRLLAENPARIFKLGELGSLKARNDADITIVDMNRVYKVDASKFHSKAKYSPFDGRTLRGKVDRVFISGQLIMENDEIVAKPGTGEILRRE